MNISKHNTLKVNRGPLLAILIIALISCISFVFTLFDPTAECDDTLVSMLWLVGLTIAVLTLFSYSIINNFKEWIIVALAWGVRIVYATINNSEIITFRGDNFYDMARGLYYGYNHIMGGTYPIITNYPSVLVEEFNIFGINRLVTCYVNAFLTMVAIFYLLKCFSLLKFNQRIRTILLIVFSFNPFTILFGAEVFREAIYIPLVTISLYFFIKWAMNRRPLNIVFAMVAIIPVAWLHSGYIMIAAGYAIIGLLYLGRLNNNRLMYKLLLLIMIIGAVGVILFTEFGNNFVSKISLITNPSAFASHFDNVNTNTNSDAGSHYLAWMSGTTSIALFILYTPIRIFYFLYSPMLWDCYRLQDWLSFVADSSIFLVALVLVLKFIINKKWKVTKSNSYGLVLIASIIIVLLTALPFAWGTYNAGTALRHRNCLLPFICLQIGICMSYFKSTRKKENEISTTR